MTPALALALLLSAADLSKVEVTERLNQSLPLDARFLDSSGRELALRDLLQDGRPIVLSLVYYRCPTLCSLMLGGLTGALRRTGLRLGSDFALITVSIDPSDTPALAAEKKRGHLQALGRPESDPDWSFLTAPESSSRALAQVGVVLRGETDRLRQFAHAAGVVVLTPDGRVSRYLYGLEYPERDLKLALVEASGGRVGTSFDRFLLTCYRYDPSARRYAFVMHGIIQGGGFAVFAALAGLLAVLWRRERKHPRGAAR
jgi:protein SCO1